MKNLLFVILLLQCSAANAQTKNEMRNITKIVNKLEAIMKNDSACTTANLDTIFGENNKLDLMIIENSINEGKTQKEKYDSLVGETFNDNAKSLFLLQFRDNFSKFINSGKIQISKVIKKDSLGMIYYRLHFKNKKGQGYIMIEDDPRRALQKNMFIVSVVIRGNKIYPPQSIDDQ